MRRYRPAPGAKVRLVCLPHAGGAATFFLPFATALTPGIDVLAVQYPGRQDRWKEPTVADLAELAARVFDALPADGLPVALFGHSMGATLAFELARLLRRDAARRPVHLFASGSVAPCRQRPDTTYLEDDHGLIATVCALGGSEALHDEQLLRLALPAIRADFRAAGTYAYRAQPPLDCPVTVFTGTDDPLVELADAEAWARHTTGPFDRWIFRGGHFFLVEHQDEILETITARLSPVGSLDTSCTNAK